MTMRQKDARERLNVSFNRAKNGLEIYCKELLILHSPQIANAKELINALCRSYKEAIADGASA